MDAMQRIEVFDATIKLLQEKFPFNAVRDGLYEEEDGVEILIATGMSRVDAEYFGWVFRFTETWCNDASNEELSKLAKDWFDDASNAEFESDERIYATRLYQQVRAEMESRGLVFDAMPCWECKTPMREVRPLTDDLPEYTCDKCGGQAIQYQSGGWGWHGGKQAA
jgi:hypothetical protein